MKILLACFPKSGSTFLSHLISGAPDFSLGCWVPAFGRREQELDRSMILSSPQSTHQIAQHHVTASEYTQNLIDDCDITPLVLVRNVFDCAISLAEHIHNESHVYPMAFHEPDLAHENFSKRLEAVIDLAIPWYISFFASWYSYYSGRIVTYESIVLGTNESRARILESKDIPITSEQLLLSEIRTNPEITRFNIGRSGRGFELMSHQQIERIKRLASHYKHIDFSAIGM